MLPKPKVAGSRPVSRSPKRREERGGRCAGCPRRGVAIRRSLWEGKPMPSLRRALVALAVLGFVMGLGAAAVILTSDHMSNVGTWAALNAALGASFIGTGLYAWWRRPHNHSGALITWVGFLWFGSALGFSDNP